MNALALFDKSSQMCSKYITQLYSTSFTLGIKTLHKRFHTPIYSIYGFVRLADEIVDTFHTFNKAKLLEEFERDTYRAIEEKISLNPVLHAFQLVVNDYGIDSAYIKAFLYSMRMDLEPLTYSSDKYNEYIYGSAEAVGLMCLQVFCEGNDAQFSALKNPAKSLGAAFQKVNFLRDLQSDFEDRGRVYFPEVNFKNFNQADKVAIEADIEKDFADAFQGIMRLPEGAKLGVLLAYKYYVRLFIKIKKSSVATIQNSRVRVPDFEKFTMLSYTYLRHAIV
jgi:15-cis-phytoene synthase